MSFVRITICDLSTAVLGILVKNNVVKGIKVSGGVVKVSAYADDLIVFCSDPSDIEIQTFFLIKCLTYLGVS